MSRLYILAACTIAILTNPTTSLANKMQHKLLTLENCISIALANNQRTAIAKEGQEIAKAQHKQALSAYWPQVSISAEATTMDEDPIYTSAPVSTAVPPLGTINTPPLNNKLRDKENVDLDLTISYLLWAGGKRTAAANQAEINTKLATKSFHKESLDLIYEVKKIYCGLVLAQQLKELGHNTLERMQATLDVTKNFYEQNLGNVKKTDYLRNKFLVDSVRTVVAELDSNEELAHAALINVIGADWKTELTISQTVIPFRPSDKKATEIFTDALEFNIDIQSLDLAIDATNEKIDGAKADYYPTITLFGKLRKTVNDYNRGMVNSANKEMAVGGINVTLPIFNGFRTQNSVREVKARLRQLTHRKEQLTQGLALQLKHSHLTATRAARQVETTKEAMETAIENRSLNERAYAMQLVETRDVIEAQLAESLMTAKHFRAIFAHYETMAQMEMLIGKHLGSVLSNKYGG